MVIPPLKLRKYLAGSVLDYEGMRDSDSPPAGVSWQVLSSSSSHFSRVLLSEDADECAYKGMNMSLGKDKASMA